LKLELEQAAYEALHAAADGRGKTCRVSKDALRALLADHGRLIGRLLKERVAVTWPEGETNGTES
jgi:hypothetical protein